MNLILEKHLSNVMYNYMNGAKLYIPRKLSKVIVLDIDPVKGKYSFLQYLLLYLITYTNYWNIDEEATPEERELFIEIINHQKRYDESIDLAAVVRYFNN